MEPEQVERVTLSLTPQQWEAVQQLLNQQRHPRPLLPLSAGTITFDDYPMLGGPIPSPTELSSRQPYSAWYGVTLSSDPSGHGVYAMADFWTGRGGNIVTLEHTTIPPQKPYTQGTIRADFNPPVAYASIDAYPAYSGSGNCPTYQPYIQALDANGQEIPGTYVACTVPGCLNNQINPAWTTWHTLTITRPQADIHAVEFSVGAGQSSDIYAVFDNLSFQR